MKMTEIEFSNKIAQSLSRSDYLVKTEINSGYGRADVVALRINKEHIEKRLNYNQKNSLLSQSYFRVLSVLGESFDSATALEEIFEKVPLSKAYIMNTVLKELINSNFVKEVQDKFYMKVNGWAPLSDEVIAIESKLSSWKRGIIQAKRYKIFANKVYLALPSDKVHLVPSDLLKSQNIGLITLDQSNNVKWIFNPISQSRKIISYKQDYVCENFWRNMQTLSI